MNEGYLLTQESVSTLLLLIPEEIDTFYVNFQIVMQKNYLSILKKWVITQNIPINTKELENGITIEHLLTYILTTKPIELTDSEYLNKLQKKKRNAKDYIFSKIKKEYDSYISGNEICGYMKNYVEIMMSPYINSDNQQDKDSLYAATYTDSLNWKNNNNQKLYNFNFFGVLPAKKRCEYFLTELAIFSYTTLCSDTILMKNDVTKTPPILFDSETPVVCWASESPELYIKMDEPGIFSVYEIVQYNPNGNEIIAEIDRIASISKTNEDIELEKAKILSEYASGKRAQAFDTIDLHIYTTIFSLIQVDPLNDGAIHTTLSELFREINPTFKGSNHLKREYINIAERLEKISRRTLSSISQDSNGRAVKQSNITFFNFDYEIAKDISIAATSISYAENKKKTDFNSFSLKELANMIITITPSSYTLEQWRNQNFSKVMSKDYKSLEESKDQVILQILQEYRINIYPQQSYYIPFTNIESKLRKIKLRNTRLRKEIKASIENIYHIDSIIENYTIDTNGINIIFKPLSEVELEVYNFENKK